MKKRSRERGARIYTRLAWIVLMIQHGMMLMFTSDNHIVENRDEDGVYSLSALLLLPLPITLYTFGSRYFVTTSEKYAVLSYVFGSRWFLPKYTWRESLT
jgi:hypothetical protein